MSIRGVAFLRWMGASLVLAGWFASLVQSEAAEPATPSRLTAEQAGRFAQLALACVHREYPNKLDHVMNDAGEVRGPAALHPAFYGCFDWHSSVHGHWLLARLLREFPQLPEGPRIRAALDRNLAPANIAAEVAYLAGPNRGPFERTYGWAWLLKLAEELRASPDPDARRWAVQLQPLADAFVARYLAFLPRQNYPIRTGVHPNTAFGLAFAWDYAKATTNEPLTKLIGERARTYFSADANFPGQLEPGGEDFFSPAFMEADLMRRVLPPQEFQKWFALFLPALPKGEPKSLLLPAVVLDRTDLKLVHLDGLNLSRAWCMRNIAGALPEGSGTRQVLEKAAAAHAASGLAQVASGNYGGEHWLASFAVYLLSTPGN